MADEQHTSTGSTSSGTTHHAHAHAPAHAPARVQDEPKAKPAAKPKAKAKPKADREARTETTVVTTQRRVRIEDQSLQGPDPVDAATQTKIDDRTVRVEHAYDKLEKCVEGFLDDGGDRDDVGRIVEKVYLRLTRANEAIVRENADRAGNVDKKGEPDPLKPLDLPHPKLRA